MQTNQGLTLDRYLEKKPRLEPVQAAKIVASIAGQLGSAAGSLLIHPGRILCAKDGSVKLLPPAAEELSLPAVVEYPAYASPEEIRGAQADERSGLYSLGCTLYQLLAGVPPFTSSDPRRVLQAHLNTPVPDVRSKAPGVSPGLAELVNELLSKDPELRVQTSGELVRRLKQCILQSQGVQGQSPVASVPVAQAPPKAKPIPSPAPPPPKASSKASVKVSPAPIAAVKPAAKAAPARLAGGPRPGPAAPRPVPARGGATGSRPGSKPARPLGGKGGAATSRPIAARAAGSGLNGSRGRASETLDDALALDEEPQVPVEKESRSYPCTIGGVVLGVLIGLFAVNRSGEWKAAEKEREDARIVSERSQALSNRKKVYAERDADHQKAVREYLDARLKSRSAADQQMLLESSLSKFSADNPYAYLLVEAYLKVWAPGSATSAADAEEADKAYVAQKAEAEKLHGEGKLGRAYNKIYENYITNKARHAPEIDELMTRWGKEVVEQGEGYLAEAQRHGIAGDTGKAIEALQKGLEVVEGDEGMEKLINGQLLRINEIGALQAASAEKATRSLEEEGKEGGPGQAEKPAEEDGGAEKPAEPESGDADKGTMDGDKPPGGDAPADGGGDSGADEK